MTSLTINPFIFYLLIFVVIILVIIFSIHKDHKRGLEETSKCLLGHYTIKASPWWGVEKQDQQKIIFKRFDSHYDWRAIYEIFEKPEENFSPDELLKKYHIILDQDAELTIKKNWFQIEGTGTIDEEKRIFLQAFCKTNNGEGGKISGIRAISLSSVLNGMIEGPYFENTLKEWKN